MRYPSSRILMITALDNVKDDLKKDLIFNDKTIEVLLKPVKLARLADVIIRD